MRRDLVGALLSWVDVPLRRKTGKFLRGLALDELQFLVGFCGSCILESGGACGFRVELTARIAGYRSQCELPDQDLKMILLVEYLTRGGLHSAHVPARY